MIDENFYSSEHIDRSAVQRRDEGWVNEILGAEETLFVPIWRAKSFVKQAEAEGDVEYRLTGAADATVAPEHRLVAALLRADEAMPLIDGHRRAILLGQSDHHAYFALDLSDLDEPAAHRSLAGRGDFVDLRKVGPLLDRFDGGLLAYARGMIHWHQQNAFCGACGTRTVMLEAGFQRRCSNAECGRMHFPRTDPAVIVAVTYDDRLLLGRQAKWDASWYSVLAGFVEPGESLEQAVRREVKEEAGVDVGDAQYHSSQPWPFPSSLMVGFTAAALNDRIGIGDEELQDVRWFSRAEVDAALEKGDIRLPPRISIARQLIEGWRRAG